MSAQRLDVLDGLRGIAVLLVLWYHVWEISFLPAPWPWLEFVPETGFIGVHLFFFLSGFVISYPFLRARLAGTPKPTWLHFAWRRFIKIAPSYLLSILVAYAIGYAAYMNTGAPWWREVLTHLLFIHTWFPDTYGAINGVLWTLSVEVEFYAIFPLVWWAFSRQPWITAALMFAVAFIWRAWAFSCCQHSTFEQLEENLPGYLDLFASGMLCAYLFLRGFPVIEARKLRAWTPLLALAGVVAAVLLLQNLYDHRTDDQWSAVWQIRNRGWLALSFVALGLGALLSPRPVQRVLANPVLLFLAYVSYNLYLYHQIGARDLLALHFPPYTGDPHASVLWQWSYTGIAFAAAVLVAWLVTTQFERRIMRLRPPWVPPA